MKPSRPEFTYSKLADKRVDMLAKAAKDARVRAEAIALQAGSEVGGLKKSEHQCFSDNCSEFY